MSWLLWVFSYNHYKYAGIAIMIFGPLLVIARIIFFNGSLFELLAALGFFGLGAYVWSIGWGQQIEEDISGR